MNIQGSYIEEYMTQVIFIIHSKRKEILSKSEGIKQEIQNAFQEIRFRLNKKKRSCLKKQKLIKMSEFKKLVLSLE